MMRGRRIVSKQLILVYALVLSVEGTSSSKYEMPVMVVAGNFTLGGRISNLAQYDPTLKLWVDQFEPHLFTYGATSGLITDIATNSTGPSDALYMVSKSITTIFF